MKKLAVLISNAGTGSNLQAIIDAIKTKKLHAKIVAVISDRDDAKGLAHARSAKITIHLCQTKDDLLPLLKKLQPDFIVLAGWKLIITDDVIASFKNTILNLHPGLIPDMISGIVQNPDGTDALWNKGKFTNGAIKQFLEKKATYAGSSIHFLTEDFDFGPVLGRTFEKIEPNDTIESLYRRLKKKENKLYLEMLQSLCNKKS